ncbi:hypothetical protein AVEN_272846-1 [Araneus ventricosus]|uniref:Uncharacterized protein n=1 Tax=Araneus ventricosus TaxID=182803 RepID=A0A4Y2JRG5_ARAVE|nr:hypothetical protein AVEN_272846-1 [Araneus ventricosus]
MRTDFLLLPTQGQSGVILPRAQALLPEIATSTHAHGVSFKREKVCDYTDRKAVSPLTDLVQNFIRTYIHDDKTVYQILSIQLFKFLSYSVRMTADIQTDRLPFDGFCPKFDRNLQIMFKGHVPNFIPVALIVFELSCSQTDIIPKLCFSDSGRSKTRRFVKISSSNFLTITILSLSLLRIREGKKPTFSFLRYTTAPSVSDFSTERDLILKKYASEEFSILLYHYTEFCHFLVNNNLLSVVIPFNIIHFRCTLSYDNIRINGKQSSRAGLAGAILVLDLHSNLLFPNIQFFSLVILTIRFEATRGLLLDEPHNFEPRSGDEDDT